MTALLTDNETRTARERAAMNRRVWTFAVEKVRQYLAEPTEDELAEIHRIVKGEILKERRLPSRGLIVALVITAVLLACGFVLLFTCF